MEERQDSAFSFSILNELECEEEVDAAPDRVVVIEVIRLVVITVFEQVIQVADCADVRGDDEIRAERVVQ